MKKVQLVGVLALSTLLFTACGDKKEEVKNTGGEKTETVSKKDEKKEEKTEKFYKVGETASAGDVEYTLVSVTLTDERNQFDKTNPENVIAVKYTVKNNQDDDIPVGTDLSVYGPDGKKTETYPNDNTVGSIAKGKSIDVTQHFGLNQIGEIELQFAPLVSLEDTVNFKADVK